MKEYKISRREIQYYHDIGKKYLESLSRREDRVLKNKYYILKNGGDPRQVNATPPDIIERLARDNRAFIDDLIRRDAEIKLIATIVMMKDNPNITPREIHRRLSEALSKDTIEEVTNYWYYGDLVAYENGDYHYDDEGQIVYHCSGEKARNILEEKIGVKRATIIQGADVNNWRKIGEMVYTVTADGKFPENIATYLAVKKAQMPPEDYKHLVYNILRNLDKPFTTNDSRISHVTDDPRIARRILEDTWKRKDYYTTIDAAYLASKLQKTL